MSFEKSNIVLQSGEMAIRRLLHKPGASPFIAHCEVEEIYAQKLKSGFDEFVQGDIHRVTRLLEICPALGCWFIATTVADNYGESGHEVYGLLERAFQAHQPFTQNQCRELNLAFRSSCRQLNLAIPSKIGESHRRMVDDYLVQAGVSVSQLPYVAAAFLRAEQLFGAPPMEDTGVLNTWEDDAAELANPGLQVIRMILDVDTTAHHALSFGLLRNSEMPQNAFERTFLESILAAEKDISAGRSWSVRSPNPVLVWREAGPFIEIPKGLAWIEVTVSGRKRRLRGDQSLPLSPPWPAQISWRTAEDEQELSLFSTSDEVLLFDAEGGRFLRRVSPANMNDIQVDAQKIVAVSKSSFCLEGEDAFELGESAFALWARIDEGAVVLESRIGSFGISATPKPRIWFESDLTLKSRDGLLLSEDTMVLVSWPSDNPPSLELRLDYVGKVTCHPLTFDEARVAQLPLGDLLPTSGPVSNLKCQLVEQGSERVLVRARAWWWPGLRQLRDGSCFDAPGSPVNFSPALSHHIVSDANGRLCLDPNGSYLKAQVAFKISEATHVIFEVPKPGITLALRESSGEEWSLKLGETITIAPTDVGGALIVRCPYSEAALRVRGKTERKPFAEMSTRAIPLVELQRPAALDDISISSSSGGQDWRLLARIAPGFAPRSFRLKRRADRIELEVKVRQSVDAIRLEIETVNQESQIVEVAMGHRPVDIYPADWLRVKNIGADLLDFDIEIDLWSCPPGVSLGRLQVRAIGEEIWRPLANSRGDYYCIPMQRVGEKGNELLVLPQDVSECFLTLSRWLNVCFANECWTLVHETIVKQWRRLGTQIAEYPVGICTLLEASSLPPAPSSPASWVPLLHPLQITKELYSGPLSYFSSATKGGGAGSDHLRYWPVVTPGGSVMQPSAAK